MTPTEIGTPRRAASPATAASSGLPGEAGHVDDVLRPQHEVELVVRGDRAGRLDVTLGHEGARHVVSARALFAAALHGGDVEQHPRTVAPGRDGADRRDGGGGEESGDSQANVRGGACQTPGQHAEGETALEHDPGEQDDTTDADDSGERTGRLGDSQAGERHPTERPREAQRLDERVGERPTDRAPPADRGGDLGDRVEQGEHRARNEIAGHGELPHPRHSGGQPGEGEHEGEAAALAW